MPQSRLHHRTDVFLCVCDWFRGLGNPSAATASKGFQLMEALVGRLGDFLAELAAAEMNETFPY